MNFNLQAIYIFIKKNINLYTKNTYTRNIINSLEYNSNIY